MISKKKIVVKTIYAILAGALIAGAVVGNNMFNTYKGSILGYLVPPKMDTSTNPALKQEAQKLSKQIVNEGSVMVKNNGTLPLNSSENTINLLGFGSYQWIRGGSGSGQVSSVNNETPVGIYDAFSRYGITPNQI